MCSCALMQVFSVCVRVFFARVQCELGSVRAVFIARVQCDIYIFSAQRSAEPDATLFSRPSPARIAGWRLVDAPPAPLGGPDRLAVVRTCGS